MFEGSMLESAHLIRTQSRWPAVISFALQATIVAIIITIPVLHPEVVKLPHKLTELAPPVMPPKPVVMQPVHMEHVSTSNSLPAVTQVAPATQMPQISTQYDPNVHNDAPPVIGKIGNMTTGNPAGNGLADVLSRDSYGGPSVVVAKTAPTGPVRISQGVSSGMLLAPIQPVYPQIAKVSHTQGTVTIHAIISKDGHIESASVTGGPMMLAQAALDAVRNARYRPYLLNGVPTEVDTTFQINFRLNE